MTRRWILVALVLGLAGSFIARAVNPPGAPDDHFLAYKAKLPRGGPRFAGLQVALSDAFEARIFDVVKPAALLVPVNKNGEGIVDAVTHLQAYKIKLAKGQQKHAKRSNLSVTDQFGSLVLETVKPE